MAASWLDAIEADPVDRHGRYEEPGQVPRTEGGSAGPGRRLACGRTQDARGRPGAPESVLKESRNGRHAVGEGAATAGLPVARLRAAPVSRGTAHNRVFRSRRRFPFSSASLYSGTILKKRSSQVHALFNRRMAGRCPCQNGKEGRPRCATFGQSCRSAPNRYGRSMRLPRFLAILGDHGAARATVEGGTHHDSPLEYYRAVAFPQIGDVSSALEDPRCCASGSPKASATPPPICCWDPTRC